VGLDQIVFESPIGVFPFANKTLRPSPCEPMGPGTSVVSSEPGQVRMSRPFPAVKDAAYGVQTHRTKLYKCAVSSL
jgi:hypothetical protein